MKKLPSGTGRSNAFKLFFILFSACILGSCGGNDLRKAEKVSIEREKIPQETGKKLEVIYTDSSYLKARVLAPKIEKFKEEDKTYIEMPKGVKANFFNKKGKRNSRLRANYGIRYLEQNKMVVKDSVLVVNRKGDTLKTEKLTWDENEGKIFSDQFVKVKTPEEIIYAKGFESNQTFTNYKFYNIEGTIQVDQE